MDDFKEFFQFSMPFEYLAHWMRLYSTRHARMMALKQATVCEHLRSAEAQIIDSIGK